MNIILVLVDSLNKHCLQLYNPDSVCRTPHLDKFAQQSFVFDNHFVGSLPCMPARRDMFTGRKEFMWRPWGSLEVLDARMPRIVQSAGLNTAIITDHYHYWEEQGNGYLQCFGACELIRGHEVDPWKVPGSGSYPQWVDKVAEFRAAEHIHQFYANIKDFQGEEDFFAAKVFSAAADWLDDNAHKGPFYLHVEAFDVHEPHYVPEPYASMYTDSGSRDDFNIWPPYQVYRDLNAFMKQTSPEELSFIRAQYLGKTTMTDTWLGALLQKMDELALWDDTMLILTTDHGHDLGERGVFGKQYPHYDSHANIPLMIWHPRHPGNGQRVKGLTQSVDLFPTLIEAAGAQAPAKNQQGRSLLPIIEQSAPSTHEAVLYGTFGQGICLTEGDWTLFASPVEGAQLYTYSSSISLPIVVDNPVDGRLGRPPEHPADQGYFDPAVDMPLWKTPITIDPRTRANFLFHRAEDPGQIENLWDKEPEQRERMLALARGLLEEEGCPREQWERLDLASGRG